ncbi:MAG: hypothetical protein C0518_13015 [Opitutus sp.]|nr:hypothetical protein [Opitutus sp.]
MQLRRLTHADLFDVADVHVAAFPRAAVSQLGRGAVRRYYETLLACDPRCVGHGAFVGNRLAGFCFTGRRFEIEPEFLRRHRLFLAARAALHPWVIFDPLFRNRLLAGLRHLLRRPVLPAPPAGNGAASNPADDRAQEEESFGVQYLVVDPRHQGQGIGRDLLHAAENRARAQGRRRVELSVFTDNAPAITFYERQGWQKIVSGSRWEGLMAKHLLAPALVAAQQSAASL